MITELNISEKDISVLASINHTPSANADDFFDYRSVVIAKPWGHEYLIFQNDHASVWMLHMKQGFRTSMHCHPNKKTSLTVLAGDAKCATLTGDHSVSTGDGLLIDKGVFHSTEALTPDWIMVMEVETPTNKQDLVRYHDAYGRSGMRYEGFEHHRAFNEDESHFHDDESRYHFAKRFGECIVTITRHQNAEDFREMIRTTDADIMTVLRGNIYNSSQERILEVGDATLLREMRRMGRPAIVGEIETLLIKRL